MITLLAVLAMTFAAFAVWLAIRIINRRERWAKWTAVALVLIAITGYPLSMGPVVVFVPYLYLRADDFTRFYYPIYWVSYRCELVDDIVFDWYCGYLWEDRFVRAWQECFGGDE
jgi:hypothetical protein